MKKIFLYLLSYVTILTTVYSQNIKAPYEFKALHHMVDSSELSSGIIPNKSFTATPPPVGTVRAIAEWEPAQAVLIAYPGSFGIPYTLIAELSQDCRVITIVKNTSQQSTVTNNYNSNGVNLSNCSFIIAPLDSYWSRDFGPWFIMTNNSAIAIVDFPYNRTSRTNDDNVPVILAGSGTNCLNLPLYGMNVLHTGGNFMCDGMGVAAMTDLVEDENPLTHAQIDTAFKQYMGITNNYITTDPLGAYIKHIDCWGKFLDVDKILIASVPTSNAQYNQYEAMAAYWANQTSSYGNNYQVYRVYEPSGQPYTNSLILNKKVLIPINSAYGTTNNNNAIAVYQNAMPGYEVLGFSQLSSAAWASTDALHCRTHEIADKGMLYIKHYPLLGEKTILTQYPINAEIYALSGSSIIADSVWVNYRVYHGGWGAWTKINTTNTSGNIWSANIPAQQSGDTIAYYIHASDQSPRSVTHPLIGMPDPHKFYIKTTAAFLESPDQTKAIIFPNPAKDFLFVQMKNNNLSDIKVRIIDLLGNELITINEKNSNDKMLQIDISKLIAGTYFIDIATDNFQQIKKVMVIR